MRKPEHMLAVRVEVVTTTFVASGQPEGVHDFGRFLENLNNPSISRYIELQSASVRPLYRAAAQMRLDTPLLVRRDEIVFANFEGPHLMRGTVRPPQIDAPALLMAPPFQIQGTMALMPGVDPPQALRSVMHGFVVLRHACVYDTDGNPLGEGELIVVNGALVQMTAATRRRIDVTRGHTPSMRAVGADDEPADIPEALEEVRAA